MLSSLEKVLGIASIGSTIANAAVLKRFLSRVMITVALAAVSGAMIGILVIAGFYGIYVALVANGMHPLTAGLIMGGIVAIMTIGITATAYIRWRRLPDLSHNFESPGSALLGRVTKLADSFIDGLLADSRD